MKGNLSLAETRQMLEHVARQMIASRDLLSEADRAIGDGDHGVGMERGFEAVLARLESFNGNDLAALSNATGMALITSVGGAAGIIFGTWFRGGAKELAGLTTFDARALHLFLEGGLSAIQERGKAKPGDKTMVDALAPACRVAAQASGLDLEAALRAVASAAREGVENTRPMVATLGKAKTLGERSLGYPDPGAISVSLILDSMLEFVCMSGEAREQSR